MKKKSVNPAMAMMAARAMRTPAARPTPMGMPQMAPNVVSTPPAMPGMKKGGMACKDDKAQDKAMIKKAMKQHDMQEHKGGKGTKLSLCGGGKAMKYAEGGRLTSKGEHADQKKSKRGAMMVKMASGGKASQLSKANGIAVRGKTKGKMC